MPLSVCLTVQIEILQNAKLIKIEESTDTEVHIKSAAPYKKVYITKEEPGPQSGFTKQINRIRCSNTYSGRLAYG